MPNPFADVERKYRDLYQAYQNGALDDEGFAQKLSALQVQDAEECWWQIQGNGAWLRYNPGSQAWEEATPPRPLPPPPPRSALAPPPRVQSPPGPEGEEPDDSILYTTGSASLDVLSRPSLAELLNPPAAQPLHGAVAVLPLQRTPARPPKVYLGNPPTCQACGLPLEPEARFCGNCGRPAHSPRCPQCHQATPEGAQFCNHCGHHLEQQHG